MHICLPADESNQKVTYGQDDAYGLVIAPNGNHRVWRSAFPGGQGDRVAGQDISSPLEIRLFSGIDLRGGGPYVEFHTPLLE